LPRAKDLQSEPDLEGSESNVVEHMFDDGVSVVKPFFGL